MRTPPRRSPRAQRAPRRGHPRAFPTSSVEQPPRCRIPLERANRRSARPLSVAACNDCAVRRRQEPGHKRSQRECPAHKAGRTVPSTPRTGAGPRSTRRGTHRSSEGPYCEPPLSPPVRSSGQLGPPLAPAAGKDGPAATGPHSRSKPMGLAALAIVGLVRLLHEFNRPRVVRPHRSHRFDSFGPSIPGTAGEKGRQEGPRALARLRRAAL